MAIPLLAAGKEILKDVLKGLVTDAIKDFLKSALGGKKPPAPVIGGGTPPFIGGQCSTLYGMYFSQTPNPARGFLGNIGGYIRQQTVYKNNLNQWVLRIQGTLGDGSGQAGAVLDLLLGGTNPNGAQPQIFLERVDGQPDTCGNPPSNPSPNTNPIYLPAPWSDGQDSPLPPPTLLIVPPNQAPPPFKNPPIEPYPPPSDPNAPADKDDINRVVDGQRNIKDDLDRFRDDLECIRRKLCATEGYDYINVCEMEGSGAVSLNRNGFKLEYILVKSYDIPIWSSRDFGINPIYFDLGKVAFYLGYGLIEPITLKFATQAIISPDYAVEGLYWNLLPAHKATLLAIFSNRLD